MGDEKEVPLFKVTQGHFATGTENHLPGTILPWVVPEGYDEKKSGKHYASEDPSITFEPMNAPAKVILEKRKKIVAEKNKPKPEPGSEAAARMEEMFLKMMNAQLEEKAESRRRMDQMERLIEALVGKSIESDDGKKKK